MSEKSGVVIIGAGHAGVSLAFQLRRDGYEGVIRLVSEEESLPYHRPPLSKELLAGKNRLVRYCCGQRLHMSKARSLSSRARL